MKFPALQTLWVPAVFVILFLTAITFRPLLPIDETRYISVAWEMFVRRGWLEPLTMNYDPYHHKPPILFWLINLSWSVFGVSRWAATVPVVLSSLACVYLTAMLGRRLLPKDAAKLVPAIMVASLPFLIYSTIILFDLTLTVFVLATLLCLLVYAEKRKAAVILLMGLCLGLGVLTKGPVMYLYTIFPIVLAAFWVEDLRPATWFGGCFLAFLISFIPVLIWLIPVLHLADQNFAIWLLWEQSAGRVTGNLSGAHDRPVYFYLPLLPLFFLPWAFLPRFWKGLQNFRGGFADRKTTRFLLCWFVPTLVAFSLIGGKQFHYLVPLLPVTVLIMAYLLRDIAPKTLIRVVVATVLVFVFGHLIASKTVFVSYDLRPVADYVREHRDRDWAFVRKYRGEVTYLSRFENQIDSLQMEQIDAWFGVHPDGLAMIRYERPEEVIKYNMLLDMPYRGKRLGIFARAP
jgi:4-amino-4-deoxy-L-arabinose transferase-like glycosyltransferase